MKKIILLTAAAMLLGVAATKAQSPMSQFEEYVQVNGSAEREIVPDKIYLKIVINENDTKGKVSVEKAEKDMIAKLKGLSIDTDKDLSIGNMGSDLKEYWLRKNQARTNAAYELKVGDAAMMGKVFQTLEAMGITDISVLKTDYSKMKELRNELRVEAMKDAKEVAQTLAGAVGQNIGQVVYIVDYNNDISPRDGGAVLYKSTRADAVGGMYETELDFRKMKINYNITAKFKLVQ